LSQYNVWLSQVQPTSSQVKSNQP